MQPRLPRYPKEEFARRGSEIYERDVRPVVETAENKGKFVAIDIEGGQWEMDADELKAGDRLYSRLPEAQPWMVRVGHDHLRLFGFRQVRRSE